MPKPTKTAASKADSSEADAKDSPADVPADVLAVDFRGLTFTIPKFRADWSTRGTVAIAESKFNVAVKYLLGEDQWAKLCAVAPTNREFNEFFSLLGAAIREGAVG